MTSLGLLVVGTDDPRVMVLGQDDGRTAYEIPTEGTPKWVAVVEQQTSGGALRILVKTRDGPSFSLFMFDGTILRWSIQACFIGVPTFVSQFNGSDAVLFGYMSCNGSSGLASVNLDQGLVNVLNSDVFPVAPPRVSDMDRDGTKEIAVLEPSGRAAVLSQEGVLIWEAHLNRLVLKAPILADFTCDGKEDVLLPLDREPGLALPPALALYDLSGVQVWSVNLSSDDVLSAVAGLFRSPSCHDVAVALLRNDSVLVVAGDSGRLLWTKTSPGIQRLAGADFQGNGLTDLLALSQQSRIVVYAGDSGAQIWEVPLNRTPLSVSIDDVSGKRIVTLGGEDWIVAFRDSDAGQDAALAMGILLVVTVVSSGIFLYLLTRRKRGRKHD